MEDSFNTPDLRRKTERTSAFTGKKMPSICLTASAPKSFSHKLSNHIASVRFGKIGSGTGSQLAFFLLKVAALEVVRRFSRGRCPFVWSSLQALQVLCCPPFKWIQKWEPFRFLVKGMQILSRPLLFLSIANAFSNQSGCSNATSDVIEDSQSASDSHAVPESDPEVSFTQATPDTRHNVRSIWFSQGGLTGHSYINSCFHVLCRICDEVPQNLSSTSWLLRLYGELENQGISLPERIDKDELQRFYTAANGDFSCLLSSVKKTIRWREKYKILSGQELEIWSNMVFWHGFDVEHRPCLIVRLGLACISLPSDERPRFAQAVVSQVEHGVLHLVESECPQVTVLVDCEGLSPLRFPMQMMRSCSTILQDHFPNRLGCLFIIRLPPVVQVIAQTLIHALKPVTRKKLKIEGKTYQKVLSEYLQVLPSSLGGICTCRRCANLCICNMQPSAVEPNNRETNEDINSGEDLPSPHLSRETDMHTIGNCDHVLRAAVVGVLIFWVLIALIAGTYDPES
ncbi:hypothetical protein RJ639_034118 [Escallonia herrerae]|uniref:CRAL-TRIO domain-containing protein n=1 Tax=Escallonia herrerae TaxID=1293975 RepID=A0AA88WVF8_9ASTE|nr:hypothetical protein RJ639_034118 [Escallonia herrerae]